MNNGRTLEKFTAHIKHNRPIENRAMLHNEPVHRIESTSRQIPNNRRRGIITRIGRRFKNRVHQNFQYMVSRGGSHLRTENIIVSVKVDLQHGVCDGEHEKPDFVIVRPSGEENNGSFAIWISEEVEAVSKEIGGRGNGIVLGEGGERRSS